MIEALYETMNSLRISVRNLALERLVDLAGRSEGEGMGEVRRLSESLLLGDAEVSFDDLARNIDLLKDERERKILRTLFGVLR